MNPITGIVGCCARAESGHAAAPPSTAMKIAPPHLSPHRLLRRERIVAG
jgi:hypothetical protein